jgi:2-methylcitrate dehydratase PrpD
MQVVSNHSDSIPRRRPLPETGVTRELARFVVESRWDDVPQQVRHEGERAVLNWLGCALAGCRDVTVERALAALREFAGKPQATLLGRGERLDVLSAACLNAIGANILDFDDTHLRTVIHPTVPVAAALLALAEYRPLTGADFLHAFILGVDAECRIGNAISPGHYERGWHITATCGAFGAAVAAGKALRLDVRQMTWALGIAATQSSGLGAMLGSMCKSYNMGHAARSGLSAALLAAANFTSSERGLEAPRGFLSVLAERTDRLEITRGLGTTWEIMQNAYKPYPCGIVIHPVIDACLDLRAAHGIDAARVAQVDIAINSLAQQLCGNPAPRSGLEGKLSLHHSAAVALVYGDAGVQRYSDACVADPRVTALRGKVTVAAETAVGKEQARVRITLSKGTSHEQFVAHARGSLARPMSDAELEAKFSSLAGAALTGQATARLIELCWSLGRLPDAGALARATVAAAR